MQVGIGLPAPVPGVTGALMLDWAKKADAGPFSSLGTIDRLVYPNFEPLVSLAAAAAVTMRVRLITTILIAPLHSAAVLAKQAATIDALSNGRLTLGLAVGGREDDFQAAGVDFHQRGKLFDQQLEIFSKVWHGQALSEQIGPIGPSPVQKGGPEILIGANQPDALKRIGRWANGFISGGGGPQMAKQSFDLVETVWKEAGRSGKPRFVAGMYFALGPNAKERATSYIKDYYSFMGPMADRIAASIPDTAETLKAAMSAFEAVGLDELILWPTIAEIDQLERLAEILG